MPAVAPMLDPNNRPGGPHLVVTAKTANTVQFFNAATLALTGEIAMPASTHEMTLSPDGAKVFASVYGGGIFGKNSHPDRRIAVIDLASRSLERMIDVGADVAPHGVMMQGDTLWATAELGDAVLAIDPGSDSVERIAIGGRPHWVASANGQVFASCKTTDFVVAIDAATRKPVTKINIPNLAEGLAVSPDGDTLYACAHRAGELHAFDTRTHALRATIPIEGAPGTANQLRRVRVSPDGRYVVASSLIDCHVAIYQADTGKQIGSLATRKAPMGFGFSADGKHAFVCCHDDAAVMEFELSTGRATREFPTASGCEFIIAYN
jgi:DNA-binding beta-propeller fold protein YncE